MKTKVPKGQFKINLHIIKNILFQCGKKNEKNSFKLTLYKGQLISKCPLSFWCHRFDQKINEIF